MPEAEIDAFEDFRHLRFVRGYYLTEREPLDLGQHWVTADLGAYTLGWDQRTPSASAAKGSRSVFLIGRAFHLGLNTSSLREIARHLLNTRQASREAYNRALYDLAGRYIVIDHSADGTFLQTDASGMRTAYYATAGGTVSSHAALTAQLVGDKRASSFGSSTWFKGTKAATHPGRSTEYEAVSMLTPNTELDVSAAKINRVGPFPRGPELTAEQAASEIVPLLQRQLEALVAEGRPLVSLTAGLDSRTTLAVTYPVRDKVTYFSYVTRRPGRESASEPDMEFARDLCAEHGLKHEIVTVDTILAKGDLHSVMRENSTRMHAPSIAAAYREQLPFDSLHIRSNIYEIGRSFFRKANPGKVLKPLTADEFAKKVARNQDHESYPESIEAFKDWLDVTGFSEVEGYDPYDLYYWEFRMGRWLPAAMVESDIAHDTYTVVNCRRILELFLSVSEEDRLSAKVFDAIIALTWPELFSYPVNGEIRHAPFWATPSASDSETNPGLAKL